MSIYGTVAPAAPAELRVAERIPALRAERPGENGIDASLVAKQK
jgi:hypothetical protein